METTNNTQDENALFNIAAQQSEILRQLHILEQMQMELLLVRKDVLSFAEAIKYLDLSDSHVYKLTAKRKIPHYKQGKLIYFVRAELDKWLTSEKVKTRNEIESEALAKLRKLRD